jgi:hypothetical protein
LPIEPLPLSSYILPTYSYPTIIYGGPPSATEKQKAASVISETASVVGAGYNILMASFLSI